MTTTTTTTMVTKMREVWVNHGIPGREVAGTYGVWERVPPLTGVDLFPGIDSLERAHEHAGAIAARVRSPTGCALSVPGDQYADGNPLLYIDSQGCVRWVCAPDGSVVAYSFTGERFGRVAPSIGAFFTRLAVESDLWRSDLPSRLKSAFQPLPLGYPQSVADDYLVFYKAPPPTLSSASAEPAAAGGEAIEQKGAATAVAAAAVATGSPAGTPNEGGADSVAGGRCAPTAVAAAAGYRPTGGDAPAV